MADSTYTIWVCVDCLATEANGSWGDDPDYTPEREPLCLLDGVDYTLGLMFSEHECDNPGEGWCECEQRGFSWRACEGCGSPLGGAREAMTVWVKD